MPKSPDQEQLWTAYRNSSNYEYCGTKADAAKNIDPTWPFPSGTGIATSHCTTIRMGVLLQLKKAFRIFLTWFEQDIVSRLKIANTNIKKMGGKKTDIKNVMEPYTNF
jgi:hypothetical protein